MCVWQRESCQDGSVLCRCTTFFIVLSCDIAYCMYILSNCVLNTQRATVCSGSCFYRCLIYYLELVSLLFGCCFLFKHALPSPSSSFFPPLFAFTFPPPELVQKKKEKKTIKLLRDEGR